MLNAIKEKSKLAVPPREVLIHIGVLFAVLATLSFVGMADTELADTIHNVGDFVSVIILAVAVPNGAYGFLQYMTAGSNVDQDEKGRTRIRNTFIGLAGVAVIQIAVELFDEMVVPDGVGEAAIAGEVMVEVLTVVPVV